MTDEAQLTSAQKLALINTNTNEGKEALFNQWRPVDILPFEACLERWGVSRLENTTTAHSDLFFLVEECVCKSKNPETPDSSVTIFKRGDKWGYALSVWNSMSQGMMWLPCVQCEALSSRGAATLAAFDRFKKLATNKRLLAWLESLSAPKQQQLSLF
jgi:hypothetical protein